MALLAGASALTSCARKETQPEAIPAGFERGASPDRIAYENLFRYFLEGFERHRSLLGARACYPGLPSRHGASIDQLEGFSRSAPLWGAWVRSGRPRVIPLSRGRMVDLVEEFRRGLIAGTDPTSDEYWGNIQDRDQRIVEASDIALSLWLFRDTVWADLPEPEKRRVVSWLRQVHGREVFDNNWHLFPVLVDAVLGSLGRANDPIGAAEHYARFKTFYRGDGWFSDGPGDVCDYYNAWGIHYLLYWLQQVDGSWDREFLSGVRTKFLSTYRYLIGPAGFPILGRSVCYRMAAPVPLVFGQETDPATVSPAEARRALDVTWTYFIQRGALHEGNVAQGYCGADPRVLDNYSGPASCLWSVRSLVVAFSFSEDAPFWQSSAGRLPVEKGSYQINLEPCGWRITGRRESLAIAIENLRSGKAGGAALVDYGLVRRVAGALLRKPFRPENREAKYDRKRYSSNEPFCGCRP